jgi:hypothetical protein
MNDNFDINRYTQTSEIEARYKDGKLVDTSNIDKLVMALVEQRDWHQNETAMSDLVVSQLQKRVELLETICESYYHWEWGDLSFDNTPKSFLLKQWYEEYKKPK